MTLHTHTNQSTTLIQEKKKKGVTQIFQWQHKLVQFCTSRKISYFSICFLIHLVKIWLSHHQQARHWFENWNFFAIFPWCTPVLSQGSSAKQQDDFWPRCLAWTESRKKYFKGSTYKTTHKYLMALRCSEQNCL